MMQPTSKSARHQITHHIRYGLTPLPFGTLLPSVATSYMLKPLSAIRKPAFHGKETVNYDNNVYGTNF